MPTPMAEIMPSYAHTHTLTHAPPSFHASVLQMVGDLPTAVRLDLFSRLEHQYWCTKSHRHNMNGDDRLRRSLSARLRSEVSHTAEGSGCQDGFPCPTQIKPLLYFYKYLQPLPDGRKLQMQMPATVVCEKQNGQEHVLCLSTDAIGQVVREDKGPLWRKRLLSDFIGEDHHEAASLMTVGMDEVVAVRNAAHWRRTNPASKNASHNSNSKSIVLTRRAFDHVINAPTELAFTIQQYVRCRGQHASIFRVTWSERESRRFAINIFNEAKISDAPPGSWHRPGTTDEPHQHGTPLESALHHMARISPFYCVSSTTGRDLKKFQEQQKIPKVRGPPVVEGVDAVKRIVDHLAWQLPGIKVRELTADFIKDSRGTWWFIRVVSFNACYRIEVPPSICDAPLMDSAVAIPDILRSKYFRQSVRVSSSERPENCMLPNCALCGCICEVPKASSGNSDASAESPQDWTSNELAMFKSLSEYRMTPKMVVDTIFQLRQRGQTLSTWEYAALFLTKSPAEFTVCFLCYKIYKSQVRLARIANELHEVYGVNAPTICADAAGNPTESEEDAARSKLETVRSVQARIQVFDHEPSLSFIEGDDKAPANNTTKPRYSIVQGVDVDPTCYQLRLVFFFHELQDGGPDISPSDFYLEYHIGQQFTRLDFEGSKCHTPNRWQLCEARVHYLLATRDGFSEFCSEKRIRVKMKTVDGGDLHGYTSLSLRPLISAAKWYGNAIQKESRVDYLVELKTDAFGLLTLKLTLGLLMDEVAFSQVRDMSKHDYFLREEPCAVFWPPPTFQACSLVVPVDWVGALGPSEYVSVLPMRSRANSPERRRDGLRQQHNISRSSNQGATSLRRVSIIQKDHQVGLPGMSAAPVLVTSSNILASAIAIAKRIVVQVAGDVNQFPTALLGCILSNARFEVRGTSDQCLATWDSPASFWLTKAYTIDTILLDTPNVSREALCVVGEILLVMLGCRLSSPMLEIATMETTIGPYWHLDSSRGASQSPLYESVAPSSTTPPQQRAVWNRAVRRHRMRAFGAEVRVNDKSKTSHTEGIRRNSHVALSKFEDMMVLRQRTSYRARLNAYELCCLFETMETTDSGYIDIAELRSLYRYTKTTAVETALIDTTAFQRFDRLTREQLEMLDELMISKQEKTQTAIVVHLMGSVLMQRALSQFDTMGQGDMNFDEFCSLGLRVMEGHASQFQSSDEEPTCNVFCLRHGNAVAFASDCCCIQCAHQYRSQDFMGFRNTSTEAIDDDTLEGSGYEKCRGDRDSWDSPVPANASEPRTAEDCQVFPIPTGRNESRVLNEPALVDTLQKLEAAEWHIRYRRESLGQATLEAALSERRSSMATGRRSSSVSTLSEKSGRKATGRPPTTRLDFHDVLQQQNQVDADDHTLRSGDKPGASQQPTRQKPKKRKRVRPNHTRDAVLHQPKSRLRASHSLSTLLRIELEDATQGRTPSLNRHDSSHLVQTIHRRESRRHQLDQLVLAELDEVKQRLARLFQSS